MISRQLVGPLHGIPFATKDHDDPNDTRITAGAAAG
jgi:Asp-tRNA(Asn)/Glu-tRNA(Gln) amidotransferase A subunit family amidase